jgi:predicted peptidase
MKSVYVIYFVVVLGFWGVGYVGAKEGTMKSESKLVVRQDGHLFEKTISKTLSCKYLLYLPQEYGEKEQKWPLILFLHGAGERGDDLNKVKVHGPPKIVEGGKDLPFIIVSPQCPAGRWWSNEVLINLLDDIESRYEVDTKRVYLTGLSMGGFGTWSLACSYPERFAAIAPICGGGEPILAGLLNDVPVWAFHGAKDELVPLRRSEEMVEVVKKSGGDVRLTVYPEAGHDSWTQTYENEKLYDWFLSHRRVHKTK